MLAVLTAGRFPGNLFLAPENGGGEEAKGCKEGSDYEKGKKSGKGKRDGRGSAGKCKRERNGPRSDDQKQFARGLASSTF